MIYVRAFFKDFGEKAKRGLCMIPKNAVEILCRLAITICSTVLDVHSKKMCNFRRYYINLD